MEERIALFNAVRSTSRAKRMFQFPDKSPDDVVFQLIELDRIPIGEPFSVIVKIEVCKHFNHQRKHFKSGA